MYPIKRATFANLNSLYFPTGYDDAVLFIDPTNDRLFAALPGAVAATPIQAGGGLNIVGNLAVPANYPAASAGDVYFITGNGQIGGGAGPVVEDGDMLVCIADSAGGDQAAAGADFRIEQFNINLANIAITGGTIDNTEIGAAVPRVGTFITCVTGQINERIPGGGITIGHNLTMNAGTTMVARTLNVTGQLTSSFGAQFLGPNGLEYIAGTDNGVGGVVGFLGAAASPRLANIVDIAAVPALAGADTVDAAVLAAYLGTIQTGINDLITLVETFGFSTP